MRTLRITLSLGAIALLAACGKGTDTRPDEALRTDLALAAQAQPYQPQQFVAPGEQQYAPASAAPQNYAPAPAPEYRPAPVRRAAAPVYRAPVRRTRARSSGGSSRAAERSGGYDYPAPAPERKVIKHTKRDAAIGAGAGAIIGAATSRDKLKGGLIGAAAGAIIGGVIGNNVDVQRP